MPHRPTPGSYPAGKFEPPSPSAGKAEPPLASAGNQVGGPPRYAAPPLHAANNAGPPAYPSPAPGSPAPSVYTAPPGRTNPWTVSASPNSRRSRVLLIVGIAMIALGTAFAICACYTNYFFYTTGYGDESFVYSRDSQSGWYFYVVAQVVLLVASVLLLAFRRSHFWDKVKLTIGTVPLTIGIITFTDWLSYLGINDFRPGSGSHFRLAAAILLICGSITVIIAVITETPRYQLPPLAATGSAAPAFATPIAFQTPHVFQPGNFGQAQPPAGTAP